MDWSLNPDPNLKGSYRRRIEDIDRALKAFGIDQLPEPAKAVAYFFGCEKLALGIVGIDKRVPVDHAYGPFVKLKLHDLKQAAPRVGVTFPVDELQYIFAEIPPRDPPVPAPVGTSVRILRNKIAHDFGPTNVGELDRSNAAFFNLRMVRFLACQREVIGHLTSIWP